MMMRLLQTIALGVVLLCPAGASALESGTARKDLDRGGTPAPVILNEFNAVGSSKWLDVDGLGASDASDVYFGRVEGNGGNWIELVVTSDHLDMRKWSIAWSEDTDTGTITFTNDALWADLRAGTIITITESCEAEGGMDTDTSFDELHDWWININTLCGGVAQETYLTAVHSAAPSGSFSVGNDDFQMTIYDSSGRAVAFGPVGEGVCGFDGVSSREVGKLEEDPSPDITPCSSYNDGTSSTFGHPNVWGDANTMQDFGDLRGRLVEIALVPVAAPSADDGPTTVLPTALTQVDQGDEFYLEVWAQTTFASGLTSVYLDIPFDTCLLTATGITHTAAFSTFGGHGTIDPDGLIDDVGGTHFDYGCAEMFGLAPDWVRVAYVTFTADAHGHATFESEATGSLYYVSLCSTLGALDVSRINFGSTSIQAGDYGSDLVLDAPVQTVSMGAQVTVDLKAVNLDTAINGVQALMHYNTQNLSLVGIEPVSPWGQEIVELDTDGDILYSVGIPAGSMGADGTIATLTFNALDESTPVITFLEDRPAAYPTLCTKLTVAATGQAIIPTTVDSEDGAITILGPNECLIGGEVYSGGDPNPTNSCETCDPSTSTTSWTVADDGTACDLDGLFCTSDTCQAGVCTAGGDPCPGPDGDDDCAESCDEDTDNCFANDADGSACDDGLFCDGTETCQSGVCGNSTGDPCPGPDGDDDCAESCDENADNCLANDTDGSACDDGLYCDGTETCTAGVCGNHTGDPCPGPDGDGDCAESCDEDTDTCTANDPFGSACDDALFCTATDACEEGVCVGSGNPCDDEDPCTNDICREIDQSCRNRDITEITLTVEIQGLSHAVTRDVEILFTDCEDQTESMTVPMDFVPNGTSGVASLTLAYGDFSVLDIGEIDYVQVTEGHTLSHLQMVEYAEPDICSAVNDFTDSERLLAGDFSSDFVPQDNLVDITDFAVLAAFWNQSVDPTLGRYADATGDGMQDVADFTAIQANFGSVGDDPDGCSSPIDSDPGFHADTGTNGSKTSTDRKARIEITVQELRSIGLMDAELADLNGDSKVNQHDILLFSARHDLELEKRFLAYLIEQERMADAEETGATTPRSERRADHKRAALSVNGREGL